VLHALLDLVLPGDLGRTEAGVPNNRPTGGSSPKSHQVVSRNRLRLPSRTSHRGAQQARHALSLEVEQFRADPPDGPVKPRVGSGGPRISATTTSNAIAARRCGLLPMLAEPACVYCS
jgi:hypothetical protein